MKTDYKDKGLSLLRKGQKGVVHAIFSRFGLTLALLIVHVLILFSVFQRFGDFLLHFYGLLVLFMFGMVITF